MQISQIKIPFAYKKSQWSAKVLFFISGMILLSFYMIKRVEAVEAVEAVERENAEREDSRSEHLGGNSENNSEREDSRSEHSGSNGENNAEREDSGLDRTDSKSTSVHDSAYSFAVKRLKEWNKLLNRYFAKLALLWTTVPLTTLYFFYLLFFPNSWGRMYLFIYRLAFLFIWWALFTFQFLQKVVKYRCIRREEDECDSLKWDVSGHVFLMLICISFSCIEVCLIISDPTFMSFPLTKFYLYYAIALVILLLFVLTVTLIHFHTWQEKFAGMDLAIFYAVIAIGLGIYSRKIG